MAEAVKTETPVWEKAWSTDEMRKQSGHWNLAGDSGLLQHLQEFSQNMISKTHEMEQMMNSLFQETQVASSKVSNIINEFHMLSNTQFVESRVYDEEAQEPAKKVSANVTKSKEQREAEVVAKISEALNFGLDVVENAFERVEIQQDSDSDEEEYAGQGSQREQVLLQPKDPYLHRWLPHLIGSNAFHKDEFVGIGDLSDEEEKMEKYDSEPSSDSDSVAEVSPAIKRRIIEDNLSDSGASAGSDLFPNKDSIDLLNKSVSSSGLMTDEDDLECNIDEVDKVNSQQPPLLAEVLDAKLKQFSQKTQKSRRKSETPSIQSRQSIKSSTNSFARKMTIGSSDEDLFGAPPEEEEEHFSSKGGLFSGTGKLFDDNEELFKDVVDSKAENVQNEIAPPSRGNTKSGKKIPVGAKSIFGSDDLFQATPPTPTSVKPQVKNIPEKVEPPPILPPTVKPIKEAEKVVKTGGLFESDEDEDLFSDHPKVPAKAVETKSSLFESDDEGLFQTKPPQQAQKQEKKLPAGAVSLFGSYAKELGAAITKQIPTIPIAASANSDSEEKSEENSRPQSQVSLNKTKSSLSNSVSSNSLFVDDPEMDDLFSFDKKETFSKPISKITADLFADEDDSLFSEEPFVSKKPFISERKASLKTDLFEEDDNLFSAVSAPAASSAKKPNVGLFIEEPKPDLKPLEIAPKPVIEKPITLPAKVVSLFDNDEDDDLFSFSSKRSQSPGSFSSKASDEIKSPIVNIPEPSEEFKETRSSSLFDEANLFNETTESPEVDLFVEPAKPELKEKKKEEPKTIPKSPNKPIGGVALFGGVDLFGEHLRKQSHESEGRKDTENESQDAERAPIQSLRAPMLKDTKDISISFDEPVDTSNTLVSAAKDRVKVQVKRRPPSRKGRQAAARNSVVSLENDLVPSLRQLPNLNFDLGDNDLDQTDKVETVSTPPLSLEEPHKLKPAPFLSVTADFRSPSTEEEDLFSVSEHLSQQSFTDKLDIKPPPTKSIVTKKGEAGPKKEQPPPPQKELFEKCAKPEKKITANIFGDDDDDDDIFAEISNAGRKSSNASSNIPKTSSKAVDLFDETNSNDIFKPVPSKSSSRPATSSLFDDDEDDGDIFSSKSSSVKKAVTTTTTATSKKKEVKKTAVNVNSNVFEDPLFSAQNDQD